ncbi:unnamed protein product [Rhodiola kirilowii]
MNYILSTRAGADVNLYQINNFFFRIHLISLMARLL